MKKMPRECRFYKSAKGCRQGLSCPFLHTASDDVGALLHLDQLNLGHHPAPDPTTVHASDSPSTHASTIHPIRQRLSVQLIRKPPSADQEMTQLERRFRSSFVKQPCESNETIVDLDMAPSDPDFPFDLIALRVRLIVPGTYPSEPSRLQIRNDEIPPPLARAVESAWSQHSLEFKTMSLLDRFKWLDRNLEQLLVMPSEPEPEHAPVPAPTSSAVQIKFAKPLESFKGETAKDVAEFQDLMGESSTHAVHAPAEHVPASQSTSTSQASAHKGTQIRLTQVQLMGISLLKCISLNLTLRCARCKEPIDVNLAPVPLDAPASQGEKWITCTTCSNALGCRYRGDLVHAYSNGLGYLDLSEGLGIVDMLPSTFCVSCNNGHEMTNGLKSVLRGVDYRLNCMECHENMHLKFDQIKFVRLSPNILTSKAMAPKRKKVKEDLGVVAGTPLVNHGTCEHYKKSYRCAFLTKTHGNRWLRFPCCGKVYPCDLCHESKKTDGHEMAWANRMICGFCSREQPYSQKPCSCGKELTRKTSGRFWEGGQGTRDREKMSKGDAHKYKGLAKTISGKSGRVGKRED